MRRTFVAGTAAMVPIVLGVGIALAGGFQFNATATGAEEVPPRASTAVAKVNVKLNREAGTASFNLRVTEAIENVLQAHLHRGVTGTNGPIAVWLYPAAPPASLIPGTTEGTLAKGEWTPASLCYSPTAPYCVNGAGDWDHFVADLEAGNLYLNLHTTAFPGGEIRGQVGVTGGGD